MSSEPNSPPRVGAAPEAAGGAALGGLKVVEFGRSLVGPVMGRFLALNGATVVKVESRRALDVSRLTGPHGKASPGPDTGGTFANLNAGKFGVTLDLKHEEGPTQARKLMLWADVVVENLGLTTLEELGLGYEGLAALKPGIIMASGTAQGHTGPHAHHPGWAVFMFALCGVSELTGDPDAPPQYPMGLYPDLLPPRFGTIGILAALDYRRRTGRGQHLRVSQFESCAYVMAPLCLDYQVNGVVARRSGNRSSWAAPHGVYRCQGEDRWVAINVTSEEQWRSLCGAMERSEWLEDARFETLHVRKQNEDELDQRLADWTGSRSCEEVMRVLQDAGVPAGRVSDARDLSEDPQLAARGHSLRVEHPAIGPMSVESPAFRLSRSPVGVARPAPRLGEHNERVFRDFLGLSGPEFATLETAGVFE